MLPPVTPGRTIDHRVDCGAHAARLPISIMDTSEWALMWHRHRP